MRGIITLDFETYFDSEYTLRKMTTEAYVRDPRFRTHICGFRMPDGQYVAYPHAQLGGEIPSDRGGFFGAFDWSQYAVLCHHAAFDGLILSHHYGVKPGLWLDTYSMAKLVLGNHVKVGLGKLAAHFGLAEKSVPYDRMRGLHWEQMDGQLRSDITTGCLHDCGLTWQVFHALAKEFPQQEYAVVDMTIRMFTEPKIIGDTALLAEVWTDEYNERQQLLAALGVTKEMLGSNEQFIALLQERGVETEWKAGKNGPIPAFAKSDEFMQELLDGSDDEIRMLAEARVAVKSNIAQTRAERLGYMSTRGPMCVYINYCGAHTTRDSGGDKVNYQNFPRHNPAFPKRSRIRRAHKAPPGYLVGVVDASQIECRMLNEFSCQYDIVQKFREKRDLYSELATQFYGFQVSKDTPAERGTGKQLELSCGYGAGAYTIMVTARRGTYGPRVDLTMDDAERAKHTYRSTHPEVVRSWKQAGLWIEWMATRDHGEGYWGPLTFTAGERKRIILPNGCPLIYDTLEWKEYDTDDVDTARGHWDRGYWRILTRRGWVKLYGAKLVENIIQALARVFVFQCAVKIRQAGVWIWSRSHDELAMLIPDDQHAQATLDYCLEVLRTPPPWMPNVPLDAEGVLAARYAK